jgi:hypothetical protein
MALIAMALTIDTMGSEITTVIVNSRSQLTSR